ncbi:hypothetical protein GUJ93_ZPchr0254g2865 [Zizania palustris]|uniref:Uncharacterized protein n=1 Tax=Zizania palustris TaxID=103762 RepID=A0A8J5R5U7_ZIZPA|nr:hypothetical protein GUJ93_ZPchr0254g2865 [Zizania palustris]
MRAAHPLRAAAPAGDTFSSCSRRRRSLLLLLPVPPSPLAPAGSALSSCSRSRWRRLLFLPPAPPVAPPTPRHTAAGPLLPSWPMRRHKRPPPAGPCLPVGFPYLLVAKMSLIGRLVATSRRLVGRPDFWSL